MPEIVIADTSILIAIHKLVINDEIIHLHNVGFRVSPKITEELLRKSGEEY